MGARDAHSRGQSHKLQAIPGQSPGLNEVLRLREVNLLRWLPTSTYSLKLNVRTM